MATKRYRDALYLRSLILPAPPITLPAEVLDIVEQKQAIPLEATSKSLAHGSHEHINCFTQLSFEVIRYVTIITETKQVKNKLQSLLNYSSLSTTYQK